MKTIQKWAIIAIATLPTKIIAQEDPFGVLEEQGNKIVDWLFGPGALIAASLAFIAFLFKWLWLDKGKLDWAGAITFLIAIVLLGIGPSVIEYFINL